MTINIQSRKVILIIPIVNTCVISGVIVMHYASISQTCCVNKSICECLHHDGYQLTKTVQNGGPQAISEILHIEYQIVCCIETYLIHIYHMSKFSKCN